MPLDPNSPEALLAAACAQLDPLKAENAKLKADLATAKRELAQVKGAAIIAKAAAEKKPATKPSEKYAGACVLSQAQKSELWEEHAKLPEAEKTAFYYSHIRGK